MLLFKCKNSNFRILQRFFQTSVENITANQKTFFSFKHWILNYFKKTNNYVTYNSTNINNSEHTKAKTVQLLNYTISSDDIIHYKIQRYKDWDNELFIKVQSNPHLIDVLKIMDFWANVMASKCTYLQSYAFAVKYVNNVLKYDEISRQHLIQCMHYVSLLKKTTETQNIFNTVLNKLHKQPSIIKEFTLEEMCIFCNSIFTTSTKINSIVILKKIVKVLSENLDNILLPENQHMLSCLVKPLRLSKYYDYDVLETIAKKVTTAKLSYIQSVVHLLALYSNALYSNFTQIEQFGHNFLHCFKNELKIFDVRVKDVDRFLWALSNLGCDGCKTEIKEVIVPFLVSRILYIKETPSHFVNSLLWLQMLQCSSDELVKTVLTKRNLERILKTGQLRDAARFSLLLTCLNIEKNELLPEEILHLQQNTLQPDMGMHLAMRKHLANVYKAVICLQTILNIKNVKVSYQIPCLYIAGITIQTNRSVHEIEVLEESVCLHGSETPHGFMKLKLRLMKKLGNKVILINKNTTELDTESLFMHIEDVIKKST